MAKKKNDKLGMLIAGIAALLGLVAIIMMFVPQIKVTDTDTTYSGMNITFGLTKGDAIKAEIFKFSFMNLLTYLLLLGGIALSVLVALGKGGKIFTFVAIGLFVVAGVFYFLVIQFIVFPNPLKLEGDLWTEAVKKSREALSLGIGAILGGILSILAGLAMGAKLVLKK